MAKNLRQIILAGIASAALTLSGCTDSSPATYGEKKTAPASSGNFLGLTQMKLESSEILDENAIIRKKYVSEESSRKEDEMAFLLGGKGILGAAARSELLNQDKYLVTFGGKTNFTVDDKELYDKFIEDELVNVKYQKEYLSEYDLKGNLLSRKILNYRVISALPVAKQKN